MQSGRRGGGSTCGSIRRSVSGWIGRGARGCIGRSVRGRVGRGTSGGAASGRAASGGAASGGAASGGGAGGSISGRVGRCGGRDVGGVKTSDVVWVRGRLSCRGIGPGRTLSILTDSSNLGWQANADCNSVVVSSCAEGNAQTREN